MMLTTVTERLGYAGLIPFVGCGLAVYLGIAEASGLFQLYSLVILAFMAGACWGVVQAGSDAPGSSPQVWSIAICLWGLLAYFMPYALSLVMLLVAFLALLWLERSPLFQGVYSPSYKKLRLILTVVVSLMHMWVISITI